MAAVPNLLGRRDYTRDEANDLDAAGLLPDRWELIDGEIISRMGQNPPHARTVDNLCMRLRQAFGYARVKEEKPIEVAENDRRRNDPILDIAVLIEDKAEYYDRHPAGTELILAVEVSDTTVVLDRTKKRRLYARAGVPEYWIVDIPGRRVLVHRKPDAGDYGEMVDLGEDDDIALGDFYASVADVLPPR